MRKFAPSCKLGKRISLPAARPIGLVIGSSGLKAGMEFRNQSPWNIRLFTTCGEMTRDQSTNGEVKRFNEDCRLAAVPCGFRKLPLSISRERLKAKRTARL